ncbi:Oxidoreductase family, alpha/beta domain-containing protein [Paramyrothecium foliicola]|nr:Oxidoreductase family, alpha/beta domain-containing protein [Paramyrothecium foliicola]
MKTANKLNVGVVGIGRMGQSHALNLLHRSPRANLLCACSPAEQDIVWGRENLEPYGVTLYASFEEMIAAPGLQAIVIASLSALHAEQTLVALGKGIHVLCEKPVCTTVDELADIIQRVEAKPQTNLMVAFVRRFDESYQDALSKIQLGGIGKPLIYRSQQYEKGDLGPFFTGYLKNSGGIFVDSIIHDIDLALMFLGDMECIPKSVSAVGRNAVHTYLSEMGDADNAVGVCEFWDGRFAFFYNSRIAAHGYDSQSEIFGSSGKVSVNLTSQRNRVEFCDSDGVIKTDPTPSWYDRYKEAFVAEVNEWVNAVLDGKPMPIPLRSSLTSLIIATSLQESLRTGQKIHFDRTGKPVQANPLKL